MSKIALPIAELKPALTGLGKIIAKRPTLPVLGHLKIERTKDGWIAITATDLESFITVRLEQPSEGDSIVLLVPHDELLKITKNCQKTDSLLVAKGESGSIIVEYAVGNEIAEARLASLPADEFPDIPKIKGDAIPLPDGLRQSIHQAMDCASTDESRLILNGACIDVSSEDGHYIVGTDGRHLFSSNSFKLPLTKPVVIPTHKFLTFKEFNADGEWQLRIGEPVKDEIGRFQISSRRWRFIGQQIEGNYPNWRQVVPAADQYTGSFLFDELNSLVDSIDRLPDHDPHYHAIGIERKGSFFHLLWKAEKEQAWKRLPVDAKPLKGKDITTFLNRHLLTKALRFGLNRLELVDEMSPMRFSNEGRQLIVMPTRPDAQPSRTSADVEEEASQPKPAAPPPAAQPTPMVNNNTTPAESTAPTIDEQIDSMLQEIDAMKDTVQDHLTALKSFGSKLKSIQREHKAGTKEVHAIRQTIKGLQGMKI